MTITKEKQRKLVVTVGFGLVFLVAAWYFGFKAISEARAGTVKKEIELTEKLAKTKKTITDGERALRKIEALDASLKPIRDSLPTQQAETWLANAIYETASRHQLSLKGAKLSPVDVVVMNEFKDATQFGVIGYSFSVEGTYFQLGEFLADLEGTFPLMVVESISITAGGGGQIQVHDMAVSISMVTKKE